MRNKYKTWQAYRSRAADKLRNCGPFKDVVSRDGCIEF
jgi:hypothetical protein